MDTLALRLHPGDDLRGALADLALAQGWEAACIVTAVGSLGQAALRWAGQSETTLLTGPFEILSLSGTLSRHGLHLHCAIADGQGRTFGGHLQPGCQIYTTAEIVIALLPQYCFRREMDPQTGYLELEIGPREST
ncbi:PPC domain-containing DNA-binding protein [Geitlerinema sp. PCC 7407]|uniref:PPC domain-containing DNA-binding protein n=1 Tax=Geitlerinema sp. PCC 7407 TaxID=1173025 RepID=UPI00029F9F7F|nr:PPC domain-containing DNA-binding protein [Geitlerinema sp. PCC 7407]AFY67914.1 protein of unknown function DUF296 [Geitlerinema sp. PCC 7407]